MGDADKWEARNRVLVVYDIWLCILRKAFEEPVYLV